MIKDIKLFVQENFLILLIITIFFISRLIFSTAPYTNLEYLFGKVAESISIGNYAPQDINFYIKNIANPLLTSLLMIPGILIFGFSETVTRVPILLSGTIFVLLFYFITKKKFGEKIALFSSLLVAFNPLFWDFSGMAYSDIPFVLFIFVAVYFLYKGLREDDWQLLSLSSLILCLAFLTKYIAGLFFIFAFLWVLVFTWKKTINKTADKWFNLENLLILFKKVVLSYWYFPVLFLLTDGFYVFWMIRGFGFIIAPEHSEMIFNSASTFIINYFSALSGYIMWLALFGGLIGIFSFFSLFKKFGHRLFFWLAPLILIDIIFFLFFFQNIGEMDFGFLEALIPSFMLLIFRLALLVLGEIIILDFCLVRFNSKKGGNIFHSFLKWFMLFVLLSLSISRPAQRYILLLLPLIALYIGVLMLEKDFVILKKLAFLATIICFSIMSLFIGVYKVNLGMASASVAEYINTNGLDATLGYEPKSHSYYLLDDQNFYPFASPEVALEDYARPYIAAPTDQIDYKNYSIIHSVPVQVFGFKIKDFSVAKKI